MKKANTYIDFPNDKIIILNKEVLVKFATSGHYCIPIGKIVHDDNHDEDLKSESILHCDDVNELSNHCDQIAIKLHRQFSHPSSDKLITLLKYAHINAKQLFDMAKNVKSNCKVCQTYKKPKPKLAVSFSLASRSKQ